ncbi:MAG: hypothetical protein Q4P29_06750 [Tissierellia bacterium]|nr:hypothetical protein [Tissierellia bacterium]
MEALRKRFMRYRKEYTILLLLSLVVLGIMIYHFISNSRDYTFEEQSNIIIHIQQSNYNDLNAM